MQVETEFGMEKGDVINFIPAQHAGKVARDSGLTNKKGWCPVNQVTFESTLQPGIHVIGDASIAGKMPKSGFSANSQAKVAANHIRGELTGSKVFAAKFSNTCWSLVATNDGIKVGANYKAGEEKIEAVEKFVSKTDEDNAKRKKTYEESIGWYNGITTGMFS